MHVASLLFVALIWLIASPALAQAPTLTPICAIVEHPEKFNGQELSVRGVFASDYFEYSSLGDPLCGRSVSPWNIVGLDPPGEDAFQAMLCDEQGGLVEVTVRGRVEARPGQVPSSRFYVLEYSDPRHIEFSSAWPDRYGVLAREATASWQGIRRQFCVVEGFVDRETLERR